MFATQATVVHVQRATKKVVGPVLNAQTTTGLGDFRDVLQHVRSHSYKLVSIFINPLNSSKFF
jgi:hypothetical protein